MIEINLLPWRELRRERKKKEFTFYLVTGLIVAATIVFILYTYASTLVSDQTTINQRLKDEIVILDRQIQQIKELKAVREALIARMAIVKNLQETRPLTVHLFDELIKIMPDGAYLTHVERSGDKITILGYTESNTNVSDLMRNIENSEWIQKPELTEIKKNEEAKTHAVNLFKLSFTVLPKSTRTKNEKY